jgi:hypothetical protein
MLISAARMNTCMPPFAKEAAPIKRIAIRHEATWKIDGLCAALYAMDLVAPRALEHHPHDDTTSAARA